VELAGSDVWERLGALYSLAAQAVADAARRGARPVVVRGWPPPQWAVQPPSTDRTAPVM
jgi:hypothetical protein